MEIQEEPIPGHSPSTTVAAASDLSATIASFMAGADGLVPALAAVTAMVVAESANTALSVPSSLYLSSLPVTVAAHLNPRTPESEPTLRVTCSPALGVIPTELSVFFSSAAMEVWRETLTSENGTAEAVTTIGTEDPPREQVTLSGTLTVAVLPLTVTIWVGRLV